MGIASEIVTLDKINDSVMQRVDKRKLKTNHVNNPLQFPSKSPAHSTAIPSRHPHIFIAQVARQQKD